MFEVNTIICGAMPEATKIFPDESFNCSISSPPFWALRDYGISPSVWDGDKDCEHKWRKTVVKKGITGGKDNPFAEKLKIKGIENYQETPDSLSQFCSLCGAWRGCLGLEPTFELYIKHLCDIYDEVWRVLRKDGTCFVNLGDTYNNNPSNQQGKGIYGSGVGLREGARSLGRQNRLQKLPTKSLCLIPQRFAIEMVNRNWILRNVIIWHKPNPMPSSATDRFTVDYEFVFFFTKSNKPTYWVHPTDGLLSSTKPKPDYLWKYYTGIETRKKPYMTYWTRHLWKRRNLWEGRDYWFEPQYEEYVLPMNRWGGIYTDGNVPGSKYLKEDIDPAQLTQRPRSMRPNALGRNKRTVWTIPTQAYPEAHFATFPEKLVEPMILSGCPEFVCKKCGKGRNKIYEPSEEYKKHLGGKGFSKSNWLEVGGGDTKSQNYPSLTADYRFKGYTDCGCKDYFCGSCKSYLTPETMKIQLKNGIQRPKEKTKISSGVGEKTLPQNERAGKPSQGNSLLQRKNLLDLWQKILRKKDAKDLLSEMRDSVANPAGSTPHFSNGRKTPELQRRLNQQRRIQNNNGQWQKNDGTPSLNGETSEKKIACKHRSASSERDKRRQSIVESRIENQKDTSRRSVLSVLQKEFQNKIVCPFCFSNHIVIKSPGWRPGVILDMFRRQLHHRQGRSEIAA